MTRLVRVSIAAGLLVVSAAVAASIATFAESNRPSAYEIVFTVYADDSSGYARRPLFAVDSDGSGLERVKAVDHVDTQGGLLWSPDGRFMAYTRWASGASEIYLANGTLSDVRQLTHLGGTNIGDSWSPDGRKLLIRHVDQSHGRHCYCCCEPCACFYYYVVDVADQGWAKPLPLRLKVHPQAPSFTAWRSDGTLLAIISEESGNVLYAVGRDRSIRRLSPIGSDLGMPQVSRDGRVAVVSGQLRKGGWRGFWLIDEEGGPLQRIRGMRRRTSFLESNLSPDGRSLAFACDGICVADIETGRVRRIYEISAGWDDSELDSLTWSPDSRSIAVTISFSNTVTFIETDSSQIAIVNADGSNSHYLIPDDADYGGPPYHYSLSWSPDSRWIAFTAGDPSQRVEVRRLLVARADGSRDPIRLSGPGKNQIWDFAWRPVPSSN